MHEARIMKAFAMAMSFPSHLVKAATHPMNVFMYERFSLAF